ncbi:MAG: hypothetical protein ACKO3F_06690 [Cyanobium sp.]
MTDSIHPRAAAPTGLDPTSRSCLGRTCLKWSADGELSALDLGLVLERLAKVDVELTGLRQDKRDRQPCPTIS